MDEVLELSDEVRELFLAGKLDALLEHVAGAGAEAAQEELRSQRARYAHEDWHKRMQDPEKREAYNKRQRDRYNSDPDYANRKRESKNSRYAADPELRARLIEYSKEYRRKRYASDPEYAERRRAQNRESARRRAERKKAEKEAQENND